MCVCVCTCGVNAEQSLSANAVHICGVCLMDVFVHYERKINRELRPCSDTSDAHFCRRRLRQTYSVKKRYVKPLELLYFCIN